MLKVRRESERETEDDARGGAERCLYPLIGRETEFRLDVEERSARKA